MQVLRAKLGEGHIQLFGTLEVGHLLYPGKRRLQCYPFPDMLYYGFNREDFVFRVCLFAFQAFHCLCSAPTMSGMAV